MTAEEMQRGIDRLNDRIAELKAFDVRSMTTETPPEIAALETSVKRTLERIFGDGSADVQRYLPASNLQWTAGVYYGDYPQLHHYREGIKKKIDYSVAILEQAIKGLQEDIEDAPHDAAARSIEVTANAPSKTRQVFVVHGHDEGARESVARFLEKIDLVRRQNLLDKLATELREDLVHLG
jgi:hypothetical protein